MGSLDKPCGGIVFIIDTSASMLNGDYAPTRWEAQKFFLQTVCNAVLCGSTERKLQPDSFGLIHSNSGRTGFSMLPCRANYLDLMKEVDNLSFAQDESIDLPKSLKLLKLSLKSSGTLPRVVIITSSLFTEAQELVEVADKVERIDCIYLGGESKGNPNASSEESQVFMEAFCTAHGCGNLVCLKPFDTLIDTWQWQEDLLSQLCISQKEPVLPKSSTNTNNGSSLFPTGSGMRGRSSMRTNMTESCRGESLDSYQHLSSDGMCKSWLPSYATLAKKYKEKGFPQHYYLAILDSLCKWQTLFSCRAGRMVSVEERNNSNSNNGAKRLLDPLKKQGVLKLLYSEDADSWCMQWKQNEEGAEAGLPPLTCQQKESKEDLFSVRFTGPSKVKFEAVPCSTGEVLGIHLVSTLYKRQPAFFWLQEEFTCEHGKGASGLVRKLQDIICTHGRKTTSISGSDKQPLLIKSLGMGSDKLHLETVLLNLMSSASSKSYYPSSGADRGKGASASSTSTSASKEKEETVSKVDESDLDKGFYSWMHTAQLDSELSEDPNFAAQIQASSHAIGKAPSSTAAQGTGTKNDQEDSLLFELD